MLISYGCYKSGGLNNRNRFSHSNRDRKSDITYCQNHGSSVLRLNSWFPAAGAVLGTIWTQYLSRPTWAAGVGLESYGWVPVLLPSGLSSLLGCEKAMPQVPAARDGATFCYAFITGRDCFCSNWRRREPFSS